MKKLPHKILVSSNGEFAQMAFLISQNTERVNILIYFEPFVFVAHQFYPVCDHPAIVINSTMNASIKLVISWWFEGDNFSVTYLTHIAAHIK